MRVVITGATGAIGHALIAECIKQNIEVLAICHRGSQRAGMLVDEVGRMLQSKRVGLDCEFPNCESSNEQLLNRETLDRLIKIEYLNLDEYATGLPSMPYDIFFHMAWSGTTGASRNDEALQQQNAAYSLDAVRLAKKLGCHTFVFAGSQAEYGRVEGKLTADTPTYPEMNTASTSCKPERQPGHFVKAFP